MAQNQFGKITQRQMRLHSKVVFQDSNATRFLESGRKRRAAVSRAFRAAGQATGGRREAGCCTDLRPPTELNKLAIKQQQSKTDTAQDSIFALALQTSSRTAQLNRHLCLAMIAHGDAAEMSGKK